MISWEAGLTSGTFAGGFSAFQKGKKYTLSAFFKCKKGTLDVHMKPQQATEPWAGYGSKTITMTETWTEFSVTTPVFAQDVAASITFAIAFDVGDFWVDGVRFYEGEYVPAPLTPVPADGARNVVPDAVLRWTPGAATLKYDVYLGDSADVVAAATVAAPLGTLKSSTRRRPPTILLVCWSRAGPIAGALIRLPGPVGVVSSRGPSGASPRPT